MFRLEFVSDPVEEDGSVAVHGRITLGDYWETFTTCLDHWSRARYERQWREAAERVLAGEVRTAFLTSLAPPGLSDLVWWWPAWREGDLVYVTEQLLLLDRLEGPFNEGDPYVHVGDRVLVSEDEGLPISYWPVHLNEVRRFAQGRVEHGS